MKGATGPPTPGVGVDRAADVPGRATLPVLWVGQFISTAGLTVVVPLLPLYLEDLGAGGLRQVWTGVTLAAPSVTLALAAPLWGRLGDRWGRKPMVVRALVGLAGSMQLMAMAGTPLQLLLARLAQGVFGGVVDASAALTGSVAPAERRGRALGRVQSSTAAGALVGPLVGGFLVDAAGMRVVLTGAAILTTATGIVAALVLREPPRQPSPSAARARPRVLAAMLQDRSLRGFVLAGVCAQTAAYGAIAAFAPYVRGMLADPSRTATVVGLLQGAMWALAIVGACWWGARNDRHPVRQTLTFALGGCSIAAVGQAVAPAVSWVLPGRLLQGFCFGAVLPSVFLCASRAAGVHRQGAWVGAAAGLLVGGQVIGSLGGGLLSSVVSTRATIALMAPVFAAGALLAATAASSRPRETACL